MGGGPVGGMAFVLVLVTFLASRLFMALNNDTLFMPVAIMLACIIFSFFASAPPTVDATAPVVTQVWGYVGELVFNLLVLVGMVKMSDRIVREMMGL